MLVAAGLLHDELHRAGAHVVHRAGGFHGGLAHLGAQCGRHAGRGRFFQHLLMAALHRAVALEQIHIVAVGVAKDLYFDMARALHVFFNQHCVIAKAVDRLALARCQRVGKVFCLVDRAHALTATACAGLDEHRVTDAVCLALQQGRVLVCSVVAGHQRHAGFFHQLLGLGFQAHGLNGAGRGPDEHQAGGGTGVGELFVFTQETVAGVDGLGAGGLGRLDDFFPAQIAVFGRTAPDVHRFVARCDMFGVCIGIRIDRYGFDS